MHVGGEHRRAIVEAWAEERMLAKLRELGPSFPDPSGADTDELDAAVTRAKLDVQAWNDAFSADDDPAEFKRGREKRMATLAEAEAARAEAVVETQLSTEQAKWISLWRAADPEAIENLWRVQPLPVKRSALRKILPVVYVSRGRGTDRVSLTREGASVVV